jgi:diguanylate cyclase
MSRTESNDFADLEKLGAGALPLPKPRRGAGFRGRAMLLVTVTLLPVLGFVLYAGWRTYDSALDSSRTLAQLLARQVSVDQGDLIDRTEDLMAGIAFMARGNDLPTDGRCHKVLVALIERYPSYASAAVADVDGNIVCLSNNFGQRLNVADRQYFKEAMASGRFVWSGPIESRSTKLPAMVGAMPLIDERDAIHGVLIFTMRLDSIGRSLLGTVLPIGAMVSLVDSGGKVLVNPSTPGLTGRTIPDHDRFLAFLGGTGPDTAMEEGLDGVKRVWAYARVSGRPDAVVVRVGLPTAQSVEAARWVLVQGLASVATLFALALFVAWLAAERLIVRPLRRLETAADLMGAGNLSARTGLSHAAGEIGRVAAKLDELAAHGHRVNRALRTLSAGNQTLLRERNERSLLTAMCRVAVEHGGYAVAYVCYPHNDEMKSIEVAARWGDDGGFITSNQLTWADSPSGNGSIARCLRTGERAIIRSIADDPNVGPWAESAALRGFSGAISLPLRVNTALVGTFTLMARDAGAFDEAEVTLLDEMAADLSFGIEMIRAEARRKQAEEIARRALTTDPAIDVPNRAWFVRRVAECLDRGRANGEPVAVFDIHLGRLQDIEDSFGYERRNEVLRQVAERLRRVPGADENFGRIPVEDFGIVLCASDAHAAQQTARAVHYALREPVRLGEALIDIQVAVGISTYPGHGDDAELLMRRASIAAREAFRKELPHTLYSGAMTRENPRRLALAAELRAAIETRQLSLHFQPKVALGGKVTGCEALVRWQHPARGMVPPLEFIPLAEEIGLIRPLTYQIIDLAVRQLHAWRNAGLRIPVAVNLSARNLYDPELLEAIDAMFSTWNVERSLLHFEITEGALVDDPATAKKTLEALSAHGARIYVDDFGTGYSSLSYLVSLPVQSLKIDSSFVKQMSRSKEARSLVASVISMAHGLGLKVVAEGVETESDVDILSGLGCDEAQGYFFSKPLPDAEFRAWLVAAEPQKS